MQNQPRQQAPTTHKGVYTMYDIKAIKDNINLEQYCKNNLTPHGKAFLPVPDLQLGQINALPCGVRLFFTILL